MGATQDEIAQRQTKARELREEGKTQQEIAEALGVDQSQVSRDLCRKEVITEKSHKPPRTVIGYRITQYTKPETAAKRIRDIFGDEFAGGKQGRTRSPR